MDSMFTSQEWVYALLRVLHPGEVLVRQGYLQLLFESCKAGLQRLQQLACGVDPFRLQQLHHLSTSYKLVMLGNMLVEL
jgi:hypothetical protein